MLKGEPSYGIYMNVLLNKDNTGVEDVCVTFVNEKSSRGVVLTGFTKDSLHKQLRICTLSNTEEKLLLARMLEFASMRLEQLAREEPKT